MSAWIHGNQLMAQVGINRSDLLHKCISQNLAPHNDHGEPIRPVDFVIRHVARLEKELAMLEEMAWDLIGSEREKLVESQIQPLDEQLQSYRSYQQSIENLNWNEFELPQKKELSSCFFDGVTDSHFRSDDVEHLLNGPVELAVERKPPEDKLELSRSAHPQNCIKKCREIAKQIWDRRPELAIAGMIEHNDITSQAKRPDGSTYSGTTIRSWIRDLCPNPKPGRRPGRKG